MIELAKKALRITSDTFDDEIEMLILAAKRDLETLGLNGSMVEGAEDPMIRQAIIVYCKSEFGFDNPDSARFKESYEQMKNDMRYRIEFERLE